MVVMRLSRANAASIEIGAGLASWMTSPMTCCFSNCPRMGSFMKNAAMATMATGMPSVYQAHRHPSPPPAHWAIAATSTGLTRPMARFPPHMIADIRARTPMG